MAGPGKRIISNHLRTPPSLCISISPCRRRLHESGYEKQVADAEVPPVEDKPQEYWEPDPETGVFIPANEHKSELEEPVVTCTTEETVVDEKSFFRPLEDLEPPPPESFTGEVPPVDPFA